MPRRKKSSPTPPDLSPGPSFTQMIQGVTEPLLPENYETPDKFKDVEWVQRNGVWGQIDREGKFMPRLARMTARQETFCRLVAEGIYTNAECARKAGYATATAGIKAAQLLDGKAFPHVVQKIKEIREERQRKYGVTLMGQLERLHQLSRGAEDANQFSAAINAEKIRSALGGLTIDRRENINKIDQLSRDEIVAKLAELQKNHPGIINIKAVDVTPEEDKNGENELLDYVQKNSTKGRP